MVSFSPGKKKEKPVFVTAGTTSGVQFITTEIGDADLRLDETSKPDIQEIHGDAHSLFYENSMGRISSLKQWH